MAKRKGLGAAIDVLERMLASMAQRSALPEPVPDKPPKQRVRKPPPKVDITAIECPGGIPKAEWAAAARNVASGSAPSTIRRGSDEPSSQLAARWKRQAERAVAKPPPPMEPLSRFRTPPGVKQAIHCTGDV